MLNTLKHFGFKDSFIRWAQTLYSDIQTCVSNNGWVSEIFNNPRGIRQRYPLSALLFILSVESMALWLLFYLYNLLIFLPTSPVFYFCLTLNQIMIQKSQFYLEQM
jgi:hypothetical protein